MQEKSQKGQSSVGGKQEYAMDKTDCYSYFGICSNGIIKNGVGFIANSKSDFDPDYITDKLHIEPFDSNRMGTPRKNGHGSYPFSDWGACMQTEPAIDAEEQCVRIVRALKDKIPALLDIKKKFDVAFSLIIVPRIYNEETPVLCFNKEIIEFCYRTGTEIGIDLYVYDKD